MIPSYYEFFNPVKILCGRLAADNIPHELALMGVRRPLVVTDGPVVKAGLLDILVNAFSGAEAVIGGVFQDTPPDSSMDTVRRVAALYMETGCDSFLAVGGGSVIDTAKAANILVTEGGDDLLKYQGADQLPQPLKPLIVVPTTAGTGSEVTLVAVVADPAHNIKVAISSPHLLPRAAVLDPRMTRTMPPHVTAATGMDALTHAIEAYTCLQKNPLSDAYAWSAITLVRDYLIEAVKDGSYESARLAMANAALLAGVAFSNSMVGMVHSLAHAAGGVAHVPHGVANGIFLPFVMEYNMDRIKDLYAELLLPLAGTEIFAATPPEARGERAVAAVRNFSRRLNDLCGLPMTLKEAGVPRNRLEEIARAAVNDGSLTMNPEEMDVKDAMTVLERAYE